MARGICCIEFEDLQTICIMSGAGILIALNCIQVHYLGCNHFEEREELKRSQPKTIMSPRNAHGESGERHRKRGASIHSLAIDHFHVWALLILDSRRVRRALLFFSRAEAQGFASDIVQEDRASR